MPVDVGDEARPELTPPTPRPAAQVRDLARLPYMTEWFEPIL
jgi:hypothetical protein